MSMGAFSISLNVKDIRISKDFYEKLGFSVLDGDIDQNWLIMKNGDSVIGLFQAMFDKNIITFNPGWNQNAEEVGSFKDIRTLQEELREKGIEFETEADLNTSGPASFTILDPDGNPILVDQHI